MDVLTLSIARVFAVPPAMLEERPEPRTREDAARERLAYIEAMGLSPFDADDDVRLLASAECLYLMGVIDATESTRMLAPLRHPLSQT